MTDCLFCHPNDPTANEIIAASGLCYVRRDNYPARPGHIEVVPRRHVQSFFDLTADEAADAWTLLRVARHLINSEHQPDGYTIGINDGPAAGQTVGHCHIHLIPRHHGDTPHPEGGIRRAVSSERPGWLT